MFFFFKNDLIMFFFYFSASGYLKNQFVLQFNIHTSIFYGNERYVSVSAMSFI